MVLPKGNMVFTLDSRPPSPARAGTRGGGGSRVTASGPILDLQKSVFAGFRNLYFSSYASMLHMVFAGSLDRNKLDNLHEVFVAVRFLDDCP